MPTIAQIKKMQSISHLTNMDRTEIRHDLLTTIKEHLDKRGYRADLHLVSSHTPIPGQGFPVEICYNKDFEFPSDKDLMALVAGIYPDYQIDWNTAEVDSDEGIVMLNLEPAVEIIPISDIKKIPPEFTAVGTGIFKRKADASGDVMEIWELKKDDSGLALVRKNNDIEVVADEEPQFKAGDPVSTPEGIGVIKKFDEVGNAFVQVGKNRRLVAADALRPYDIKKEKTKLQQYYSEIYGEEMGRLLVEQYGDVKK